MDGSRSVGISKTEVKTYAQKLGTSKQTLDDLRMKNAKLWDDFEEAGGNKAALKAAMKLAKQDVAKSADFQFHFEFYKDVLGLTKQIDALDSLGAEDKTAGPEVIEGDATEVAEATA